MNVAQALEARLSLTGKTAIVTGAASGIGRATAKLISALGARTVFVDRNPEGLDVAVAECNGQAGAVSARTLDLADAAAIETTFKAIAANAGASIFSSTLRP